MKNRIDGLINKAAPLEKKNFYIKIDVWWQWWWIGGSQVATPPHGGCGGTPPPDQYDWGVPPQLIMTIDHRSTRDGAVNYGGTPSD